MTEYPLQTFLLPFIALGWKICFFVGKLSESSAHESSTNDLHIIKQCGWSDVLPLSLCTLTNIVSLIAIHSARSRMLPLQNTHVHELPLIVSYACTCFFLTFMQHDDRIKELRSRLLPPHHSSCFLQL